MHRSSKTRNDSASRSSTRVEHLNQHQVQRLSKVFELWYLKAPSNFTRRVRGRYWLSYLLLRYTGARIGEVFRLNDLTDIDLDRNEVRILPLESRAVRGTGRTIPVPVMVIAQIADYWTEFPDMRGKVFALDQGNFRREFYHRAEEAEIPRDLSHPHVLRHTRVIEMLRAGVPLTAVQDLMGHVMSRTTALYLQKTGIENTVRTILEDRGLL